MTERRQNEAAFRQRLLANESWSGPAHDHYEQSIHHLLSRRLSRAQRIAFAFISALLIGLSGLAIALVVAVPKLHMIGKALMIEGAVLQFVAAVYLIVLLRRGAFHARRQPAFVSNLAWIGCVLVSVHLVALVPFINETRIAIWLCGLAGIVLLGAGVALLRARIEQAELNMHERMLALASKLLESQQSSAAAEDSLAKSTEQKTQGD